MIKNYDSQENKISIYSNHAVHLCDCSRRRNEEKSPHSFFETGGRTGMITSPLIDTRKNANDFVFIRLCTYGRWNLLFTQHSEDIAECRSLDTHTHKITISTECVFNSANRSE